MSDPKDNTEPKRSPLEALEDRRNARKAAEQQAYETRLVEDLEKIDELEIEHGDSNVAVVRVPYTPGLPAAVAARCPKPAEIKRMRAQLKPKHEKDRPDQEAAVEQVARGCLIYPDVETFAALCIARPGLSTQLGKEAIKLAVGNEESEGKG
jgi:hypothetical protein